MITLPAGLVPNGASPSLVEFGGIIRPATGAEVLNLRRNGNRFRVDMTLAPQTAEARRVAIARLLAAKTEGLRIAYPLQRVNQSGAGTLVVNGGGQGGNAIALRGGTPGFQIREGWWLSIQRSDGRHYLHNVRGDTTIAGGGTVLLPISPNLRYPFADGATINLVMPMIEGLVDGIISWNLQVGGIIDGIGFSIEEVG
tara:strand:+ start:18762 stop:19355 length:594 start_codon:yes stop_codon:yes gene_type:complete